MNFYFIHIVPVVEHNYCWVKERSLWCYLEVTFLSFKILFLILDLTVNRTIA